VRKGCAPAGAVATSRRKEEKRVEWWSTAKALITEETGLSRDALHLLAGIGAYLILTAILPRRASPWLPWLLILVAGLANEYADYLYETWPGQWRESLKDMATTLGLPTLLILLGRFAPDLLVRRKPADAMGEPALEQEPAGD
jgi:hypothetical protein